MEAEEPPSTLFLYSLAQIDLGNLISLGLSLSLFIALLAMSGILSGSEVAFFSLTKKDLQADESDKDAPLKRIIRLLQKPKLLLATILILNNTVNIGIILLGSLILNEYFSIKDFEVFIGNKAYTLPFEFFVKVIAITFLLLLFGEIIPKIFATKNPIRVSRFSSGLLWVAVKVCKPLSNLLMGFSNFLDKRIKKSSKISVEQLSQALELAQEDNSTTAEEQKILEGIVNFGQTETRQIMTPRVDVFAISTETPFKEVVELIAENGFSRIPVFEEQIDKIQGVLYAKDLIPLLDQEEYDWKELLRPTFFIPESRKLDDLLQDFQSKKIHLAVVVDEYGGTSGVVSLEDVIEEIVGDISDEFDQDEVSYSKLDEDNYVLDGKTSLKDFYRIMNIEEEDLFEESKGESETIAGFLLEIMENVPKRRQTINFHNYVFLIESIQNNRINRIKVTRNVKTSSDS